MTSPAERYLSEQERYWQGEAGSEYIDRNGPELLEHRVAFWDRVLDWDDADAPESILEYGANIGLNLRAIRLIHRNLDIDMKRPRLMGVEINTKACEQLDDGGFSWANGSMLDHGDILPDEDRFDMTVSMGTLIHVAPNDLSKAYAALHLRSLRYVMIAEYFCPTPREIVYRGKNNLCWARDFCGEFMDIYRDQYELQRYGFIYKRDEDCPLDNINWFLLERRAVGRVK